MAVRAYQGLLCGILCSIALFMHFLMISDFSFNSVFSGTSIVLHRNEEIAVIILLRQKHFMTW